MERQASSMGANRTGIDMSPKDSAAMIEAARNFQPGKSDGNDLAAIERSYIEESDAIGSVPVPGTAKGMMKALVEKLSGSHPEMFINKLGERLAFERSGVRIYEAFIVKCSAADKGGAAIPADKLREIRDQEAEHFQLLKTCIEELGADPTAQTPDADVSGVASMGMVKVVTDPRTTVPQALEAMLSIELTDNAAWELLIKLAEDLGLDDMAARFGKALTQEEEHLHLVRGWYEQAIRGNARMSGG